MAEVSDTFDLAAACTRRTQGDLQAFMEGLAARLESALPNAVAVRRKRRSILSGEMRTAEIVVRTESGSLALALEDGRLAAQRMKIVRGVTISSQTIAVPLWLDELVRLVAASGDSAQAAHSSLHDFLVS